MKHNQILLAGVLAYLSILPALSQSTTQAISAKETAIRNAQDSQQVSSSDGEKKASPHKESFTERALRNEHEVQKLQDDLARQDMQYNQYSEVVNSFCTISAVSFNWWSLQILTYTTLPTKPCDIKEYLKISVASVKEQLRGADNTPIAVVKGGTHFRTMDVARTGLSEPYIYVGNIKMRPEARTRVTIFDLLRHPSLLTIRGGFGGEYQKMRTQEASYFRWDPGSTIYYLEGPAPERETFVMTAFTSQMLPTLNRGNLYELASTLAPPRGWTFRSKTLKKVLEYRSGGLTFDSIRMIDEYGNFYVQVNPDELR